MEWLSIPTHLESLYILDPPENIMCDKALLFSPLKKNPQSFDTNLF